MHNAQGNAGHTKGAKSIPTECEYKEIQKGGTMKADDEALFITFANLN